MYISHSTPQLDLKWQFSLVSYVVIYFNRTTTNNCGQMVFGNIISSPRASLSLQQVLHLANVYLENARKESDPDIALVLCYDTEVSLKKAAKHTEDKGMREGIASIYIGLGELLSTQDHRDEAQAFYKKSEKWG
jgi:hypothetical protein